MEKSSFLQPQGLKLMKMVNSGAQPTQVSTEEQFNNRFPSEDWEEKDGGCLERRAARMTNDLENIKISGGLSCGDERPFLVAGSSSIPQPTQFLCTGLERPSRIFNVI